MLPLSGGLFEEEEADALAARLRFGGDGLIPAVAQRRDGGVVLMAGFMDREALRRSLTTGLVHYWSRGRGRVWLKGEKSKHFQRIEEVRVNCEENALLLIVDQVDGCCHHGYSTCFYRRVERGGLETLGEMVFDPREVYGDEEPERST